ncbi:MAG: RNA polymerase sigma factor [Spirochaetia bacterium]
MDSESLYEELYNDCYSFVKSRIKNTEETEDIVQTAFLKALDNERLKICGWLRVIARVNKGRIASPDSESERDECLENEFGIGNVGSNSR